MEKEDAKRLVELLNRANVCWHRFCDCSEKFSDADIEDPESADYWAHEADRSHDMYRAYVDAYQIITHRSISGYSQLEGEFELLEAMC